MNKIILHSKEISQPNTSNKNKGYKKGIDILLTGMFCCFTLFGVSQIPVSPQVEFTFTNSSLVNAGAGGGSATNNGSVSFVSDRCGNAASAASFTGASSNSSLTVPSANAPCLHNSDYTISVWVNETTRNSGEFDAILAYRSTGDSAGFLLGVTGSGGSVGDGAAGTINFLASSSTVTRAQSSTQIQTGTWYNVLLTYSLLNKNIKMYINGSLADSSTLQDIGCATTNLVIGGDDLPATNEYWFNGTIDDVLMYDRVLTDSEINNIFETPCNCSACQKLPTGTCPAITVTATEIGHTNTASASASGGVGPYTYSWSNTQATDTATGLTNGSSYTVTATDANGCSGTHTVTIATGIESIGDISDFTISPNPSNGIFTVTIHLSAASDATLSLSDLTGTKIYESTNSAVQDFNKQIDLGGISAGIYFVNVKTAQGAAYRRIVVK